MCSFTLLFCFVRDSSLKEKWAGGSTEEGDTGVVVAEESKSSTKPSRILFSTVLSFYFMLFSLPDELILN